MNTNIDNTHNTPGDFHPSPDVSQGTENFRQTEIPPTSRLHYITGIYALNIPDNEGTTGDWHHDVFWHPVGVQEPMRISLGGEAPFDTNHVFEDMGVQEARKRIIRIGLHVADHIKEVYVANHIRATLDLAFSEITLHGQVTSAIGASSDWLDTPQQKQTLLHHAAKLGTFLVSPQREELEKWIEHEESLS